MKRLIILSMMSFAFFLSLAQNWKPFYNREKYNYSLGNNNYYASIWIDSAKLIGNDSVFFLNKIIKKVKNSDAPGIHNYYLNGQSQFFLSKHRFLPNGDILFEEPNKNTFLIKSNAQLDDQWIFDTTDNYSAKVSGVGTKQIFGTIDSIKIITISSLDTVVISKNYGIIEFPIFDSLNQHVQLAGIEGRNLGILIPKYFDFFNFNVGDTFCYKSSSSTRWQGPVISEKLAIAGKIIKKDTLIYEVSYKSRQINYDFNQAYDTSYLNKSDSTVIIANDSSFLNSYPNQILGDGRIGYTFKPITVEYDSVFNTIIKSYKSSPFCQSNSDTIVEYAYPYGCSPILTSFVSYGVKIGLVKDYYYESTFDPWGISNYKILTGCFVNGHVYGSLFNDQIFTGGDENNPHSTAFFNFYPNPARDEIIIEVASMIRQCSLKMYNVSGQLILSREIKDSRMPIDIRELKKGIYLIKFISDESSETRKLIKE